MHHIAPQTTHPLDAVLCAASKTLAARLDMALALLADGANTDLVTAELSRARSDVLSDLSYVQARLYGALHLDQG